MGGLDPIRLARRFSACASIPRGKRLVRHRVCAPSLIRCQSNIEFPCHWHAQMHASSSPTVLCNAQMQGQNTLVFNVNHSLLMLANI